MRKVSEVSMSSRHTTHWNIFIKSETIHGVAVTTKKKTEIKKKTVTWPSKLTSTFKIYF